MFSIICLRYHDEKVSVASNVRKQNHPTVLTIESEVASDPLAFAERLAHGYEIMKRAAARSGGILKLDAGSLYQTALHCK